MDDCDYHVHSLVLMDLLTLFFWSLSHKELLCDFLLASHSHRLKQGHPQHGAQAHLQVAFYLQGEDLTASLGNLCPCFITHTAQKCFCVFGCNLPCSCLCPLPLVPALDTTAKSLAPSMSTDFLYWKGPLSPNPSISQQRENLVGSLVLALKQWKLEGITCGFAEGHMMADSRN